MTDSTHNDGPLDHPSDAPSYGELADEYDELSWSWDSLTGGERDELEDDDIIGVVLFAGVSEDEIESHKEALRALSN